MPDSLKRAWEEENRRRQAVNKREVRAAKLRRKLGVDIVWPLEKGLLLNEGHPDELPDAVVPPSLAAVLKPHQRNGVQFLWDNAGPPQACGCVIAHAPGLGKTLQMIAFSHAFTTMMHDVCEVSFLRCCFFFRSFVADAFELYIFLIFLFLGL